MESRARALTADMNHKQSTANVAEIQSTGGGAREIIPSHSPLQATYVQKGEIESPHGETERQKLETATRLPVSTHTVSNGNKVHTSPGAPMLAVIADESGTLQTKRNDQPKEWTTHNKQNRSLAQRKKASIPIAKHLLWEGDSLHMLQNHKRIMHGFPTQTQLFITNRQHQHTHRELPTYLMLL